MSGSSTDGVIFPIMINHLIVNVGFAWSIRISAFMILGLLIIGNLTVKARTAPHPQPPMTVKEFFSPLTETTYALTAAGNFLFTFSLFIPVNYLIVQAIAGGMALWILASSNAALMLFAGFFGFLSGAFISLGPALIAQISPIRKIGIRQGLLFAMMSVAALTTSPIAGAIVSHEHGRFTGLKVFAGVMCLAGSTLTLLAKIFCCRHEPHEESLV